MQEHEIRDRLRAAFLPIVTTQDLAPALAAGARKRWPMVATAEEALDRVLAHGKIRTEVPGFVDVYLAEPDRDVLVPDVGGSELHDQARRVAREYGLDNLVALQLVAVGTVMVLLVREGSGAADAHPELPETLRASLAELGGAMADAAAERWIDSDAPTSPPPPPDDPPPRAREFGWGAPSRAGFRPGTAAGQRSVEVDFVLPDLRGLHPSRTSPGAELAHRVRPLLQQLVDAAGEAVEWGRLRIEVFGPADDGYRAPGASIATAPAGGLPTEIDCPRCGESIDLGLPVEHGLAATGDPVPHACENCGAEVVLRVHQTLTVTATPA